MFVCLDIAGKPGTQCFFHANAGHPEDCHGVHCQPSRRGYQTITSYRSCTCRSGPRVRAVDKCQKLRFCTGQCRATTTTGSLNGSPFNPTHVRSLVSAMLNEAHRVEHETLCVILHSTIGTVFFTCQPAAGQISKFSAELTSMMQKVPAHVIRQINGLFEGVRKRQRMC